jgi:hypothetical protein
VVEILNCSFDFIIPPNFGLIPSSFGKKYFFTAGFLSGCR